jgi:hypothetical protein
MLTNEFNKFYQPYFINQDLTVTPVKDATVAQAANCEFLTEFDWSRIDDVPLVNLVKSHIEALPMGTTFISAGADADLIHRYFEIIFKHFGRGDIQFVLPDKDITEEFVELSAQRYFCSHPFQSHCLYTMKKLVDSGVTTGIMGPFISAFKPLDHWTPTENYNAIPFYRFAQDYPELIVPNFSMPFARAFFKDLQLPNCRIQRTDQVGSGLLVLTLLQQLGLGSTIDFTITDGDDWNWYPNLLNRNWQNPVYYKLQHFL